jgi:enamine deaminase RidA (YjgF/YER057c/UK114 family)
MMADPNGPEARLAALGLELPEVSAPLAAYTPTARTGDLVFTAGQLPLRKGELIATGTVGGAVNVDEAVMCAQQCALNALAAIKAEIGDLAAVRRVVKVVVFVASAAEFTGQATVANGASQLLGEVFGEAGRHARSAVGVAVLPLDAPVEVELVVEVG